MLDLLFVVPPSRSGVYGRLTELAAVETPVWAGLLAQHALDNGLSVEILDAEALGINVLDTSVEILSRNPRLAVFCIYGQQPSASTQCMPGALAVLHGIKDAVNHIPTIALGTHPSALPAETLVAGFDFVCEGEGPHTVMALHAALVTGVKLDHCPAHLLPPGLWWKGKLGVQHSAPAPTILGLDLMLTKQAWQLLDMRRYRAHNWHLWSGKTSGGYASVQTSLGCPFKCTFCCINAPFGKSGIRYWPAHAVVDQIETLYDRYGITNIKIPDEMFCLSPKHVTEIAEKLCLRFGQDALNIWSYARVDTVKDERMLALMRRAGFRWLGLGIESGSKLVRDGAEKGRFGNEQIFEAVRRVQAAGIHVGANYIFGLPDDTYESCDATYRLAEELNTEYANFYCAMAYPGSQLHKEAREKGWRLPESEGGPGWLGYSQHAYEALPLRTEALSAEELLDIRDGAWVAYFSRPAYYEMIAKTFGPQAVAEVDRMVALGQPPRKHRNNKEMKL